MASNNLTGLDVAVRRQLERTFNNVTQTTHTVLGAMIGLDAYYDRKGSSMTVRSAPLDQTELQINYELGLPYSQFIDPMNPDFAAHSLPPRQGYSVEGGTLVPAGFTLGPEEIFKYQVNRFKGDDAMKDWIKKVANAAKLSIINTLNAKLFPTAQMLAPTLAGGTNGQPQKDQIMAFGYPLQAGGSGNAAGTTSTSYPLYTIDLNQTRYQAIRAVNAGTTTTPFGNLTPSNLRSKILIPVDKAQGKIDLAILGAGPYNYMVSNAEDSVRLVQSEMLTFGAQRADFPGVSIMLEHALTDLETNSGYAEGYFVSSDELLWGQQGGMAGFDIYDKQGAPTLMEMQGYGEAIFFIRNPRRCAHAFNIRY